MAKIGFLGSAFDPITNGHLITAQEILDNLGFDKIYFMPSSSKRVDKKLIASDEQRLAMIELAIQDNPQFGIETIEMSVPAWEVYTYQTMRKLKEKYPNDELWFLMGADLLIDIADLKWSHEGDLLSENKFVVIRRNNIDMLDVVRKNQLLRKYQRNFEFLYAGEDNNISSSYIREEFENGHNPRYYTQIPVYKFIVEHKLYGAK